MGKLKQVYRSLREDVLQFAKNEYGTDPERLWKSYPNHEVLRHESSGPKGGKWYAIIMEVRRETLGLSGEGFIDILNVKPDPMMVDLLRSQKGYLPAYHMNKQSWLSILLDGSVSTDNIFDLLDQSYQNTADKKNPKKQVRTGPRDWLIPANPKYYDVISAFNAEKIIDWKQSSDVHVGDLVYMYVAAPYSAILYKCRALEVNLPYNYETDHLTVKKVMKIELLQQYDPDFMPLERMRNEFGVYSVRGPRSIPNSMKYELDL